MFRDFLYLLRLSGIHVSMGEWMSLLQGLDQNLHRATFSGFYFLCRCVLVKSEADFDKFDRCFLQYFQGIEFESEVSDDLMDWLNKPESLGDRFDEIQALINQGLSEQEIEEMLKERMQEQHERHDGGKYWVGTGGMSVFGNSGFSPNGIRVGGESKNRSAFRVAGERKFRDFRGDSTLDTRQFEVALRSLRQFSGILDLPATEFDVENTIDDTCKNGGSLKIRYKRPRQNTVKLLLLMDSGGSMDYYSHLCSTLFQAVSKTAHFKDIKTYYFHNCPYNRLYLSPTLAFGAASTCEWVLSNLPSDYKVIFVGDGQMAPYELDNRRFYQNEMGEEFRRSGYEWLSLFRRKYPHAIWLNPSERPSWGRNWTYTYDKIEELFPMFPLTVDGLEEGMKKLLVR
ncbi:MAG: VWA domain-containing protein [Eubacteriales bacterium]